MDKNPDSGKLDFSFSPVEDLTDMEENEASTEGTTQESDSNLMPAESSDNNAEMDEVEPDTASSDGADDEEDDDFVPDMSSTQFLNHEGQVFSVRFLCPSESNTVSESLAIANMTSCISGGEDDCAYEWDPRDGHVIRKFDGFSDSVTVVSLNTSRTLIALGSMDGLIRIFKTGHDNFCQEYQISDLEWVDWHPGGANILMAGTAEGDVWMYLVNTSGGSNLTQEQLSPSQCKVLASPGCACTTGSFLPNGKRLAAGYKDGSLRIWDLKTTTAKLISQKHDAPVTQIFSNSDGTLVASGSEDGLVLVTHADNYREIARYQFPIRTGVLDQDNGNSEQTVEGEASSVEAIVFAPSMPFVIFGGVNTDVVILDLNTNLVRSKCSHERGVSQLKFAPPAPFVLYSAGIDGVLRSWDIRNGALLKTWTGHENEILDFDIDVENKRIVTSGADNFCRVFEIDCEST